MKDTARTTDRQPIPAAELRAHLRATARTTDAWDVVFRPGTPCTFPARANAARRGLKQLESDLAQWPRSSAEEDAAQKLLSPAIVDLESNIRLLRSAVIAATENARAVARLPRVALPPRSEEPRAAAIAALYLRAVQGEFTTATFSAFIQELQTTDALTVGELWNMPAFLQCVLL